MGTVVGEVSTRVRYGKWKVEIRIKRIRRTQKSISGDVGRV